MYWSLILIFTQGLLCAYNGFYIMFIMSQEDYDHRIDDMTGEDIVEPVHGFGNVLLTLFHWIFALQYWRASAVLRVLIASDTISRIQKQSSFDFSLPQEEMAEQFV